MANVINYATAFVRELKQKYTREALSSGLTTERVQFVNANTIAFLGLIRTE